MLSRELLREQSDRVRELLSARGIGPEALDSGLELDQKRRTSLVEREELKRESGDNKPLPVSIYREVAKYVADGR